jgi:hypothetical protein
VSVPDQLKEMIWFTATGLFMYVLLCGAYANFAHRPEFIYYGPFFCRVETLVLLLSLRKREEIDREVFFTYFAVVWVGTVILGAALQAALSP